MEVEDGCVWGEGVNESQGEGIRGEEGGKPVVDMWTKGENVNKKLF